jgi:DNA-binding transcriptional LysR family regulator
MKLDERHLAQLSAVVDAGGVTEGAASLGSSQPALSRTLALLEKRVGEPLFVAGRKPLQPTAIGRQLAIHGRAVRAAALKAAETISGFRRGAQGAIRIAGVPFFMDAVVSGFIASFQMQEPDIQIDQSYGHFNELMRRLLGEDIDLAVTPLGTHDISRELIFEPLIPPRNVVGCSSNHPLLAKARLTRDDLMRCSWVAPLPGSPLMLDLTNILMTLGVGELAIRYSGGSLHSVVNYLANSQALAIMPLSVIHSLPAELNISALPLSIPQPERMLGVAYRQSSERDPVNRKFLGHIRSNMSNLSRLVAKRDAAVSWQAGPFMLASIR